MFYYGADTEDILNGFFLGQWADGHWRTRPSRCRTRPLSPGTTGGSSTRADCWPTPRLHRVLGIDGVLASLDAAEFAPTVTAPW